MTLIPNLTFTDYEWFPWSICNGCGMPAGNANPSGHLVPSPFWDLLMLQLLRPNSSNLPCLYSTFHLEYPLVLSRFCLIPICNGDPIGNSIRRSRWVVNNLPLQKIGVGWGIWLDSKTHNARLVMHLCKIGEWVSRWGMSAFQMRAVGWVCDWKSGCVFRLSISAPNPPPYKNQTRNGTGEMTRVFHGGFYGYAAL